jgi:two-component system, cell cycle sensor histidine kinase and response regulator CckA
MSQTVVLLAEDEAAIRMLVTMSLQREHISVLPATDADEALQVARNQEKIDLLLTDVQMCSGSMNGIELAESILHDKPGTKVLVMSGYPGSKSLAAEKGLEFLPKPFTAASLTDRVREVLSKVPAQSDLEKTKLRRMTG